MNAEQRQQRRRLVWGIAGVLLLGLVGLSTTQAFAAAMTVTAQPLQNTGTDGKLTKSATWSSASFVTRHHSTDVTINGSNQVTGVTVGGAKATGGVNASVTLKDSAGATLASGTAGLGSASGAYSTAVSMSPATVLYQLIASIAASYANTGITVQLTSVADSYGKQNLASANLGTAPAMEVDSRTNKLRRSFVSFNVSSIPAGSTVDSATLRLCATTVPSTTRTYNVHQVTASWVETTITWTNQPAVAASATASATTPASAGCMTWSVAADVQAWVSGTANNGWRVSDSAEGTGSSKVTIFRTREDTAVPADQPKLDVIYTPP